MNQLKTFGVEIECYIPSNRDIHDVARILNEAGIHALREDYNHGLRDHWKVVTDGSLDDNTNGCEVVSPVLRGDAGLAMVVKVCDTLRGMGCYVNNKCGLHVHIGVPNAELQFFKNLFTLYAGFEPIIDGLMPPSRSNNEYCKSVRVDARKIARCQSAYEISYLIGSLHSDLEVRRQGYRHVKLNINSFWRHGTIEFRQHSGTVAGEKINHWVKTCMAMVERAEGASITQNSHEHYVNDQRYGSNRWVFVNLLMREGGVTTTEFNEQISAPREVQCATLINQLRIRVATRKVWDYTRNRKVTRYFLDRSTDVEAISNINYTREGFFTEFKVEPETKAYLKNRFAYFDEYASTGAC